LTRFWACGEDDEAILGRLGEAIQKAEKEEAAKETASKDKAGKESIPKSS
jgi:hypothetical protein